MARAILLKPIQQEVEISKRKLETVIQAFCSDDSQVLSEVNSTFQAIFSAISIELTH